MQSEKFKVTPLERSWILYDVGNSAFVLMIATLVPIFFNALAEAGGLSPVNYLAYWGYASSVVTVITAVLGPILGTLADTRGFKKPIFMLCLFVGVAGCCAMGLATTWLPFLIIFILAKIGFSGSLVFYDSMLGDVTTPERMDVVSSQGYAWGYIGSCVPFVVCLALVLGSGAIGLSQMTALSVALLITAVWWLGTTLPLLRNYKQINYVEVEQHAIRQSFVRIGHTLKHLREDKQVFWFLLAFFCYIDGISIYSSRQETRVLNVYNWGEYISDGSDDSLDTIAAFEDWYKATYGVPVKVNYDTYASNEDMYAKLKSGAVSYDVVIPSDYMIARMEAEDMLLPLNYDNIPNYQYISEDFRGLYYDPDDTYTVPYTYGIVGVIYNANVVDEADTGSWDLMWNPKYASNILQFNNARDALGTAMYRAGIDVNTTDHADWQQALQALVDQRPLVKSYVMDEIYNMMESGEAAVAAYYAGDYFTMCDAQADSVDLQFYYPENTNYFIDAMCIPTSCRDQELAECFINFMLSREAAVANAEYIYYASPNRLVYDDPEYIDDMGEDTMAILYPDIGSFRDAYNRSAYRNLDQDTLTYVNSLWETLKIN